MKVYLCDTWRGVVKTGEVDIYYRDGKHDDTRAKPSKPLMREMRLDNVELLEGIFPEETGEAHRRRDVSALSLRRRRLPVGEGRLGLGLATPHPGGVVVFDDYGFAACPGVTKLVDEQRKLDDRLVIHNLNGHALLIKSDRESAGR